MRESIESFELDMALLGPGSRAAEESNLEGNSYQVTVKKI